MAGARTLANGRKKWMILTTKPTDPTAMAVADLASGINVGDRATLAGTFLRAAASNTVDSTHFNSESASVALTEDNWTGQIEPYEYLDTATSLPDAVDNAVHDAVGTKGTILYIWERRGPKEGVEPAIGDPYKLFEALTDRPQEPAESGYIRDVVPLMVQQVWEGVLA